MEKENPQHPDNTPKEPEVGPEMPVPEPTLVPSPEAPEVSPEPEIPHPKPEPAPGPEVPQPQTIPEVPNPQPEIMPDRPVTTQPETVDPFISQKQSEERGTSQQDTAATQAVPYADLPNSSALANTGIKPKWNWGAFSFTMWFGIANRAYLGLLILIGLIPWIGWIFAIVWMIVYGFNGEKWALENRSNHYRDEEEFRKIMDGWNRAGLIAFIVGIAALLLVILLFSVIAMVLFNNMHFIEDQFNQNYNSFSNY